MKSSISAIKLSLKTTVTSRRISVTCSSPMAHKNKTNFSPYKARQKAPSPTATQSGMGAGKLRGTHKKPEKIFSAAEANDRLYDLFRHHGFADYPHSKRQQLADFYALLMEQQQHENFTRLTSLRDIGIKHFIDCLMVPQLTELKFPLLDVGTGPGFPGIPLKIHFPEETILLAEGVQKRVNFLKEVREKMELNKLLIFGRNINPEFVYPVQGVITRAVEDIRNTLGNVINSLQTGGNVYFMKGPGVDPEIEMALKTWGEYYKLEKDIAYELPQTPQQRRLLIFKKIKTNELNNEFFESLGLTDEDDNEF